MVVIIVSYSGELLKFYLIITNLLPYNFKQIPFDPFNHFRFYFYFNAKLIILNMLFSQFKTLILIIQLITVSLTKKKDHLYVSI